LDPVSELAPLGTLGPDQASTGKQAQNHQQQPYSGLAIGHIALAHQHFQQQAEGIHQDMPFASFDLLATVITPKPSFSLVFTDGLSMLAALAVVARPARWRTCSRSTVFIGS